MKYMVISDIHGSRTAVEKALMHFDNLKCDFLIVLGDILYHGPRNPLPEGHDPKGAAMLLNSVANRIIAIRGNCDAEVDQMVLDFPCMSETAVVADNGIRYFATHGQMYNEKALPRFNGYDVMLFGHTHLWMLEEKDEVLCCNPGSIALPKEGRPATFALIEDGQVSVRTLHEGEILALYKVN